MKRGRGFLRPGFTFVELAVGMIVLSIVTIAMTRLLMSQMRFYDRHAGASSARTVSRVALNRILADVRTIDADSGVVSAAATDITLRVPYAMGISCSRSVLSLLPLDSTTDAAGPGGYAWRQTNEYYKYVESGVTVATSTATTCADSSVQVMSADGGRQVSISPQLPSTAAGKGTIVFLIRRIRYQFKASTLVPGAYGLYRQQLTPLAAEEEIAAPFSSSARFRFFVGDVTAAQDNPPAANALNTLRGFELIMNGQSEKITAGEAARRTENFTTAVFFKNRRS